MMKNDGIFRKQMSHGVRLSSVVNLRGKLFIFII